MNNLVKTIRLFNVSLIKFACSTKEKNSVVFSESVFLSHGLPVQKVETLMGVPFIS